MIASFVIPIYKVEECFLRECLDSLRKIENKEVEFILIDDGSPDNSGSICDDYQRIDNRFLVIHKENEGVSVARNTGIKLARGEYITFVDSDDWIEAAKVDDILAVINETNFDAYVCGQYVDFKNTEPQLVTAFDHTQKFYSEEIDSILPLVFVRGYKTLKTENGSATFCNAVGKFISTKLLKDSDLMFDPKIKIGEDALFFLDFFSKCKSILYTNESLYHYRMRASSANHFAKDINYKSIEIFYKSAKIIISNKKDSNYLEKALCYRCYDLVFEQFVPKFYLGNIGFVSKMRSFDDELKNKIFREIIDTIQIKNMNGLKNKIKLALMKVGANKSLFILQFLWITINGSMKRNSYY